MLPEGKLCSTGNLVLHRKMVHGVKGDARLPMQ